MAPVVVLWALLLAAPAAAIADPVPSNPQYCAATSSLSENIADVAANPARWHCRNPQVSLSPERTLLRFEIDHAEPLPTLLVTRRSPLEKLQLLAFDRDGSVRSASYTNGELQPALVGSYFKAPLPEIGPDTRYVVAAFDRVTHEVTLRKAQVSVADPGETAGGRYLMLLLSALCGMLLLPLIFNSVFYRILRERFVLWHSALTTSWLLTILINSGLSIYIVDLAVPTQSKLTSLVFGLSVVSGAMFAHSFIEPGKLNPLIRRALPWGAYWAMAASVFHAFFPFVGRVYQTNLYYIAYIPVLALLIWMVIDALQRDSRAAKFQLIGWAPLLLVGIIRQLGQLTPLLEQTDAMLLFYAGCVFEVIATTIGVADRFMALKNQRDEAQTEARLLEQLSERDPLTGLLNRRVIEDRWELLRAEGFSTIAVVDLDHFKAVNDSFGHAVGDEVLKCVAEALQPDTDTIVARLGGEEFIVMLRGEDPQARAERRRQAIARRVAAAVRIDRVVTASMGLVEAHPDAMPGSTFQALYERADQLLYEAKENGRNRTVSEKLMLFRSRRKDRRKTVAAA